MYLGSFGIDDYVGIPAATHRFSSGAAYAATSLTYSIYEEATTTGLDEDVDMTPASPFDSITGCYWVRRQLTAAAGFEAGKNYLVVVKATVDSVSAIQQHTFQVAAKVDSRYVGGTSQTGRDIGASVLLSSGTGTGQISLTSGAVTIAGSQIKFKKNVALANFAFPMFDAAGALKTGLTVTASIRKDNGSFAALAGSVTEIGTTGWYTVDWAQAETNADVIAFSAAASGANPTCYTILPQA